MGIELINWMLYNVLPPLIFFMSLGGTILVVSRVVLRVRRDQVATELQSHVSQVSKNRVNKVQDLAGILAPNQISVQNFKNRMSYLLHAIKGAMVNLVLDIKDWRKNRSKKKEKSKQLKVQEKVQKQALKSIDEDNSGEAEDSAVEAGGIAPPTSRFRDPLRKLATQAKDVSDKSQGVFKKYAAGVAVNIKERQVKTRQEKELAEKEKEEAFKLDGQTESEKKKAPVISMKRNEIDNKEEKETVKSKAEAQVKTKSIGKFFKKEPSKSVLEQAEEALADAQVQQVEDILVPYIVEHPKDITAYMMLGKAAISRKNWAEATEIFEQVAHIKPETKGCYAALGEAAYESGNLTKAIEALQRAHDQSPEDTMVIRRLIKIANRMDNQPMQRSLVEELKVLEQEDHKV